MKKLTLLLFLVLFTGVIYAQNVKEKLVYDNLKSDPYTMYDFNYDENTGSFVYAIYDTVTQKTRITSNKGDSKEYSYFQTYDIVYDNSGNYFAVAIITSNDENYTADYFLLRNGMEILSSSNIQTPLVKKDDGIYFIAYQNGKDTRVKYSFASEQLEYGKSYDTIFLAAAKKVYGEGEPAFEIGFTKTGKEYYAASKNGKHVFVVGEKEYGPYDEIQYYSTYEDKEGNVCFVAKEIVNGKNYYFVVQGDKKYSRFASIYLSNAFDKDNIPVYSASEDFDVEFPSDAYIVKGSEIVSKNFSKGAYDILFTPSGKLVYTGTDTLKDGTYVTKLFIDGKEFASANSIWNINFFNDDTPYYYVSDVNYNTSLYKGKTKISYDTYSSIGSFSVNKLGTLSYTAMIYGDYEKNIPNKSYYIIGNEKFGPYDNMYVGEYEPAFLLVNDFNDYVYVATSNITGAEGESITKYYAVGKSWKSPEFEFIADLKMYNNDFYYTGYNYGTDGKSGNNILFKNGQKIAEYNSVNNLKLDDKKGVISFLAQKDDKVYFVEINL
ncbi:MAG: hypothetical protein WC644_07360 [Ignavibacteria bacterium]